MVRIAVLFASALTASAVLAAPQVPGPIKKKTLITSFAAGEMVCKGSNVEYRHTASLESMIELYYYEHDPKRIWMKAGRTRLLGYDVSCEMNGAETSNLN